MFIPLTIDPKRALRNAANSFSSGNILPELFQNARRAGARRILHASIHTAEGAVILVADDGDGLRTEQDFINLIGLHTSGWSEDLQAREQPAGLGLSSLLHTARTVIVSTGGYIETTPESLAFQEGAHLQEVPRDLADAMARRSLRTLVVAALDKPAAVELTKNNDLFLVFNATGRDGGAVELLDAGGSTNKALELLLRACAERWSKQVGVGAVGELLELLRPVSATGPEIRALARNAPPMLQSEGLAGLRQSLLGLDLQKVVSAYLPDRALRLACVRLPELNIEVDVLMHEGSQFIAPQNNLMVDWYGKPIRVSANSAYTPRACGLYSALRWMPPHNKELRPFETIRVIRPTGPVNWSPLLPARDKIIESPEFERAIAAANAVVTAINDRGLELLASAGIVHIHGPLLAVREDLDTARYDGYSEAVNAQLDYTWRSDLQRLSGTHSPRLLLGIPSANIQIGPESKLGIRFFEKEGDEEPCADRALTRHEVLLLVDEPVEAVRTDGLWIAQEAAYPYRFSEKFIRHLQLDVVLGPVVSRIPDKFGGLSFRQVVRCTATGPRWLLRLLGAKVEGADGEQASAEIRLPCMLRVTDETEIGADASEWEDAELTALDGRPVVQGDAGLFEEISLALWAVADTSSNIENTLSGWDSEDGSSAEWGDEDAGGYVLAQIKKWLEQRFEGIGSIANGVWEWVSRNVEGVERLRQSDIVRFAVDVERDVLEVWLRDGRRIERASDNRITVHPAPAKPETTDV